VNGHPVLRSIWALANLLLIASAVFLLYALFWEYSTRQYLRGFSDAVVPANAAPEEKVQAILDWMKSGPARQDGVLTGKFLLRDPEQTLNYRALLQVCGSASNAFINLASSSGLQVRRLLLLSPRGSTTHVDTQVLLNGRWIVVDPTFRIMMRGPDGALLTAEQLKDPQVFRIATSGLQNYLPEYSFEHTADIHFGRIPFLGPLFGKIATTISPGAAASPLMTLLVERESLTACVGAAVLFLFFCVVRLLLGWLASRRLGIKRVRLRDRLRTGSLAFLRH